MEAGCPGGPGQNEFHALVCPFLSPGEGGRWGPRGAGVGCTVGWEQTWGRTGLEARRVPAGTAVELILSSWARGPMAWWGAE